MKRILLVLFFASVAFSCGDKKSSEQELTLMQEVVAVHDELMKHMGALTTLEMELELASDDANQAKLEELKKVTAANTEMFAWMQEFGTDFTFNEGQELPIEKQQLLQSYHERIVLLQGEVNEALKLDQ